MWGLIEFEAFGLADYLCVGACAVCRHAVFLCCILQKRDRCCCTADIRSSSKVVVCCQKSVELFWSNSVTKRLVGAHLEINSIRHCSGHEHGGFEAAIHPTQNRSHRTVVTMTNKR